MKDREIVLLTGASGFIGRHLFNVLNDRNYEVIPVTNVGTTEGVPCNLLDKIWSSHLITTFKPTLLIHAAWDVTSGYRDNPNNVEWLASSFELLKLFYDNGGRRAITIGSCFEYDTYYEYDGVCKPYYTPRNPENLYGICKNALFEIANEYTRSKSLSYAHARLFYLYGPGESKGRLVPNLINGMLKNEKVKLGSGQQIKDFLYVTDVANAIVDVLSNTVIGPVNIGSGEGITLGDIAYKIANIFEKSELLEFGALPYFKESSHIVADISVLKALGWEQQVDWETGLARTIDWWRNNG